MADRHYAGWIAAYALQHAADRRDVVAFARAAPANSWDESSALDGWAKRDILAHLAGGNDRMLQTIVLAVLEGTPLTESDLDPDTDAENARGVAERRPWSIARLIAELEREETELQDLLARLTEEHEHARSGAMTYTLGELFRAVASERHDIEHLRQRR